MRLAVWAAVVGLVGVLIGIGGTTLNYRLQSRDKAEADYKADYRAQLRSACVTHASNLSRYESAAQRAGADSGNTDKRAALDDIRDETRVSTELVRLLANSIALQEAARLALRHVYAVSEVSHGRPDPRAEEYHQVRPYARFRDEFKKFLIESRRELGLENPEDVFALP